MGRSQSIEEILSRRLLLGEIVARNSRVIPDREAVVYGNKRFTYRQFNQRVNRLAHAFLDLGVKKGTKVAILLYNCNEFLEAYFALAKIGGVAVPLNFRLSAEEIKYIVNHSDSEAFILGEAFVQNVKGMQQDLPQVKTYITVSEKPVEGMLHYESWIAGYPDDEPLILVDEDDPVFIMYTAGTTGKPKGAVLTHKNEMIEWMLLGIFVRGEPGVCELLDHRQGLKAFAAPPIFHLAAFGYCQFAFFDGHTVVLPTEVFNPAYIMKTIEEEKIDAIILVPAMAFFILLLPDLDKYDASSLKMWISGAAVLPTQTRKQIMQRFPNVKLFDFFGQTEMSPMTCGLRPFEAAGHETSVGRPIPFLEVRLVDENDRDVPVGQVGEIVYRGPTVMKEYYKDPEATANAMRNGWFHSTDLFRRDEDGFLYVVDRKKDMIVSGGENIYPAEVEEVIYKHPKVVECAVIGVYDEQWGESVKAVVVCRQGECVTEQEIIDHCKLHLASYKKPKSVDFVDALPRNAAGKVLKTELRKRYGKSVRY
ncbi:MAG: long-chain-fatty-acid--CoA ligase [Dehalococcoidia bacterium]|nr:long-chain-fatty-acid--CoA ligase [Dehalococcoidia bacterium]